MRSRLKFCLILAVSAFGLLALSASAQRPPANELRLPAFSACETDYLKHVLVIGATKGFEHDSISAAMNAIYNMGRESGLWDTEMRTDTELLTKKTLPE